MENLFKEHAKNIKVYIARETIIDPYEKNVELTNLNPLPLKAIVTDLTTSQATWKMPGIEVSKAKELIIEKKYRSLIEKSQKITIQRDTADYYGWKDNAGKNMQIREEGDYIRLYIYSK